MRYSTKRIVIVISTLFVVFVFLTACGGGSSRSSESAGSDSADFEPPAFKDVSFDEASAEGNDSVMIDTSHSSSGYFAVRLDSDAKVKLQVTKDDESYVYDLPSGKAQFFPFQLGDGSYVIRAMKNITGDKYSELYGITAEVQLDSEFEPFLRPNQYADYSEDSACVRKAREFADSAADENEFITEVYDFICDNITYDKEKASGVRSGYIPVPDEVMASGKGICFDYASLAASMLRSQGIPVKIVFGYVGENGDLYHAWNMYYTKEAGWVAVDFRVDSDSWNRMDLTFSANGKDSEFIGDGSNYSDVFIY